MEIRHPCVNTHLWVAIHLSEVFQNQPNKRFPPVQLILGKATSKAAYNIQAKLMPYFMFDFFLSFPLLFSTGENEPHQLLEETTWLCVKLFTQQSVLNILAAQIVCLVWVSIKTSSRMCFGA